MFRILIWVKCFAAAGDIINFDSIPETNSPPANRYYHLMEYNEKTNELVIFGGVGDDSIIFNDIWTFNITSSKYSHLVPSNDLAPTPRINAGGFMDSENSDFYIFGGKSSIGTSNEMWKFNLVELKWTLMEEPDEVPPPIHYYAYTKDETDELRFFIFGGIDNFGELNQTWVYFPRNNSWVELTDNDPGEDGRIEKLGGGSMVYYSNALYIAAGELLTSTDINQCKKTYRIDLDTRKCKILDIPENESYVETVLAGYFLYDNKFYLVFGWDTPTNSQVETVMYLDLNTSDYKWKKANFPDNIGRDSFGFSLVKDTAYIFGGYKVQISTNEFITLDLKTNTYQQIHEETKFIPARMYQSMVTINGKLYMFGGKGLTQRLEDLWIFDIIQKEWLLQTSSGTPPGARSSYASTSQGDIMVIWGGVSDSGYLNDLYKYEVTINKWTKIEPSGNLPSGKRGACMMMDLPKIYLFGGESLSGLTNELWVYDTAYNTYSQLSYSGNDRPKVVKYSACDMIEGKLFVALGATEGEEPICTIYSFNLTSSLWSLEMTIEQYDCRTTPAAHFINKKYLMYAGGQVWGTDANNTVIVVEIDEKKTSTVFYSDVFFYAGASAFHGNTIYMFGGGTLIGNTIRLSIPSYNFYSFNLSLLEIDGVDVCSKGTFFKQDDKKCHVCQAGSYNDEENIEDNCTNCAAGTYNSYEGAGSIKQCYPCPDGFYNPKEGSKVCYVCPAGMSCPIGSTSFSVDFMEETITTQQPESFKPDIEELNRKKYLLFGIVFGIGLISCVVILLVKKVKFYLHQIDLFKRKHNYDIDQKITMKKNTIGGFFGIVFIIIAIVLIVVAILDFIYNNTIENKALIPLVILNNEEEDFRGDIEVELILHNYGSVCDKTIDISEVSYFSLNKNGGNYTMTKVDSSCVIKINLPDCKIDTGAGIDVKLQNENSYCSDLEITVTSTSSIEDKESLINEKLHADENKVFRGYEPSTFNILLFPSLYQSTDSNKYTGYHVSLYTTANKGTMYEINELPFSANLLVRINLIRSSNGLYTKRYLNQTLLALFSTLIGSVFGILGAAGGVMRVVEGNYFRISKFVDSRGKAQRFAENNALLRDIIGVKRDNYEDNESDGSLSDIVIE